jgi:hypothetical protein
MLFFFSNVLCTDTIINNVYLLLDTDTTAYENTVFHLKHLSVIELMDLCCIHLSVCEKRILVIQLLIQLVLSKLSSTPVKLEGRHFFWWGRGYNQT